MHNTYSAYAVYVNSPGFLFALIMFEHSALNQVTSHLCRQSLATYCRERIILSWIIDIHCIFIICLHIEIPIPIYSQ